MRAEEMEEGTKLKLFGTICSLGNGGIITDLCLNKLRIGIMAEDGAGITYAYVRDYKEAAFALMCTDGTWEFDLTAKWREAYLWQLDASSGREVDLWLLHARPASNTAKARLDDVKTGAAAV